MKTYLIAAISDNNAIGRNGEIPWKISDDLKHFKSITAGHPVIMGRKTFESLGRPLPGRTNIVISSSMNDADGIVVARSYEEALRIAEMYADEAFVIGGGKLYAETISKADRLFITHVHIKIDDADAFFPEILEKEWNMTERSGSLINKDGTEYEFVTYERK